MFATARKRHAYTIEEKLSVLDAPKTRSERSAAEFWGVSRWNVRTWKKDEASLRTYTGAKETR